MCQLNVNEVLYMSFFFLRETILDFGIILENKNHGGYGQWPSEIGNPWNLNPQEHFFSKSAKFDSLEKKDLYDNYSSNILQPCNLARD